MQCIRRGAPIGGICTKRSPSRGITDKQSRLLLACFIKIYALFRSKNIILHKRAYIILEIHIWYNDTLLYTYIFHCFLDSLTHFCLHFQTGHITLKIRYVLKFNNIPVPI